MMKKVKTIHTLGKRKIAIARATARAGTGLIHINSKPLDIIEPELARLMITEPIQIAGDIAKKVDISVNVRGGGVIGQAEASRQAIAKALVQFNKELKEKFLEYDRSLIVADPRRTEPHKPSRSKDGPRTHKQRSKR